MFGLLTGYFFLRTRERHETKCFEFKTLNKSFLLFQLIRFVIFVSFAVKKCFIVQRFIMHYIPVIRGKKIPSLVVLLYEPDDDHCQWNAEWLKFSS